MTKDHPETVVSTDLLVIGGGFGGLYAAIKARQAGTADVLIVDKGTVALTGKSRLAAGSTIFLHEGDDLEEWVKAVFRGQHGICDQDMVRALLAQSTERLRELEDWGIHYRPDPRTGGYIRMPSRGLVPAQMTRRPTYKRMVGGKALTTVLRKVALGLGVRFLNRVYVSDLVTREGRVLGAVGCQRRTGEFFHLKARAVVLATADCSFRGNYAGVKQVTGCTYAMAGRAGAELSSMEFMCTNTGPVDFNFEGTGPAGKLGARFVNAAGEDFMPRYHPEGTGAEINYLVQAMALEAREGRGPPFYLDFRPAPNEPVLENFRGMGGWMPLNVERLEEAGRDLFNSRIPWAPAIQTQRGGLKTGMDCMSNVQGLFAAGIAHSTGPGLFNGWSSAKCIWSGTQAGISAADFIKRANGAEATSDDIAPLRERLFETDMGDGGDRSVDEITGEIQETIFDAEVSILKHASRLEAARARLEKLRRDDLPRARIPDLHEFIKFKETESMFVSADLFLRASLLREESRFDHNRDDFPGPDDANWLKWIVFGKDIAGGHRLENLPWERYAYQPADLGDPVEAP